MMLSFILATKRRPRTHVSGLGFGLSLLLRVALALAFVAVPVLTPRLQAEPAPASVPAPVPAASPKAPVPIATNAIPLVTDPAAIDKRLEDVLARPEYMRKRQEDTFSKIQELIFSWLQSLPETLATFPYAEQLHQLTYFIMWGILIGVFIATGYWVWKMVRMAHLPLEQIRRTSVGTRFFAVPESYEPRINAAITSGAWSEAVLFRWRKFLSTLESRDLVKADRTQTNWEYVNQLLNLSPADSTRELLLSLARTYDLYIYGHTPLDEPGWKTFRERVDEAEAQMNRLADSQNSLVAAAAAALPGSGGGSGSSSSNPDHPAGAKA